MKTKLFLLTLGSFALWSCGGGSDTEPVTPDPVDTIAPTLSISAINAENTIGSSEASSLSISGTSDAENGQTVTLAISNVLSSFEATSTIQNGTWQIDNVNVSTLPDGPIRFTANVSDLAGNAAEEALLITELDQNNAELDLQSTIAIDNIIGQSEAPRVRVIGTTNYSDGTQIEVIFDDGTNQVLAQSTVTNGKWAISSTNVLNLSDGNIFVLVKSADDNNIDKIDFRQIELDRNKTPIMVPFAEAAVSFNGMATEEDPTLFTNISSNGLLQKRVFDNRTNEFETKEVYAFTATLSGGQSIEISVNKEFTESEALSQATFYANQVGRLPQITRSNLSNLWIHKGDVEFLGQENGISIHTEKAEGRYEQFSSLNEVLIREGARISILPDVIEDTEWNYATRADGTFISLKAEEAPLSDDVLESFLGFLAYKHKPASLNSTSGPLIRNSISYRMLYFESKDYDLGPFVD